MLRYVFELLPIALAIPAIVLCARKYHIARRNTDRIVSGLAVLCALLLILAQSSWWASYTLHGDLQGTWLANQVWTIFNCLTMAVFITIGWPRKR